MTLPDGGTLIIYVVVGFLILQLLTWVGKKVLKLDNAEEERLLQIQLNNLKNIAEDYKKEIDDLKRQSRVLAIQNEDTMAKLTRLTDNYNLVVEENRQLRQEVDALSASREAKPGKILFVVIGSDDKSLVMDLASLRAVRSETGLEIKELVGVTPGQLKREIDIVRNRGSQIYMHMAILSDKDGYQLGNQIVDVTWLSSILEDVIVLFVAGADSSYIGEFLGVVPYVLTIEGNIPGRELSQFSRIFWAEIGKGMGPEKAIKRALDRSSQAIKDKLICHWEN